MAPPINPLQKQALDGVYYKTFCGIEPLYHAVKGFGISNRQVRDYLHAQRSWQLHRVPDKRQIISHIRSSAPFNLIQADFVDFSRYYRYNSHFKWLFTFVDIHTHEGWAYPMKQKTQEEAIRVLRKWLSDLEPGTVVKRFHTDNGSEFINAPFKAILKARKIRQTFGKPGTPTEQATIERFNGTLKRMILKGFTANNDWKWVTRLSAILKLYNTEIRANYRDRRVPAVFKPAKFAVGDIVRQRLTKSAFEKGFSQRWSDELFKVVKVIIKKEGVLYRIRDFQGKTVPGVRQNSDLLKANVVEESPFISNPGGDPPELPTAEQVRELRQLDTTPEEAEAQTARPRRTIRLTEGGRASGVNISGSRTRQGTVSASAQARANPPFLRRNLRTARASGKKGRGIIEG